MKVSILVIGVCLFGIAIAASIECNIDECRKPMKIYEELGCKPIYGSKSCCPKRFECSNDIKIVKDEDKCTYKGVSFEIGEVLPRKFTNESKCLEACICLSRYEEEAAKFECAASDCGISSFIVPGCVNIFGDVNECCSTSIVCDDNEKKKLGTCWDGDTKYYEGEKFISKSNPCYECLCHEDFDNTTITDAPHCRKLNCEIELKYKSEIQRGCLPIFENDKCCPVDWKCPQESKKMKRSPQKSPEVFIITPSTAALEEKTEIYSTTESTVEEFTEESTTEAIKIDATTTEALKETTSSVDQFEDQNKETNNEETSENSSTSVQISTTEAIENERTTTEEKQDVSDEEPTIVIPAETATESHTASTEVGDDHSNIFAEILTTTSAESTTSNNADETTSESQKYSETTTEKEQETTESSTEINLNETQTPLPTAIVMLVTTLKEFLSNIQLNATKLSDDSPPASFVNYTISRSLSVKEKEEEEPKSILKRSVDLNPQHQQYNTKHSSKGVCSFGVRLYKVGEQIKTDNECLECFCNYAPIGHCIKKEKCIA